MLTADMIVMMHDDDDRETNFQSIFQVKPNLSLILLSMCPSYEGSRGAVPDRSDLTCAPGQSKCVMDGFTPNPCLICFNECPAGTVKANPNTKYPCPNSQPCHDTDIHSVCCEPPGQCV
ncbi:Hypothetical protein CINCED_3A016020 [Cinara cedri]|uniref:Uncharacterized protein n=1 Tax=Cinara cedri TaxID=506608 RepID=A0A5E4MJM6_9HEMI|nr:Hypothetical protein CINCED_3A016020 [Cinara cedri]